MNSLKPIILFFLHGAFINCANGQSFSINNPNPSDYAALEVTSWQGGPQGVLLSRLTTAQRLSLNSSLSSAEESLLVFDSDLNAFYWWDGTAWQILGGGGGGSGTSGQSSETNGLNNSSELSMSYNASSLILTDITQSVTTGPVSPAVKLSGMLRVESSGLTYSNQNNLGLLTVNSYLQRAEDAAFTVGLTDLQIGRCNPYFKIVDSYYIGAPSYMRTLQYGAPCSIPIEYFDNFVLPNTTYYYRVLVTITLSGQQPTAGNVKVLDRSLITTNLSN